MKKDNEQTPKNKWSQLLKKKWFFPAVYITIAAVLLTVVVWYQNVDNQIDDVAKEVEDDYVPNMHDDDKDSEAVMDQQETIKMPIEENEKAEIVTKFYDYEAKEEEQQEGLILYNDRYYQSTGIGIKKEDDSTFDVVASLSGEVVEVKEDPLLGNVVVLKHEEDVKTYYASLGDVEVDAGDELKQGETIGVSGKNLFTKEDGVHVHFELRKDGTEVDPEKYFNQPLSKLDDLKEEKKDKEKDSDDKSDDNKKDETESMKQNDDKDETDKNKSDEEDEMDSKEENQKDKANSEENEENSDDDAANKSKTESDDDESDNDTDDNKEEKEDDKQTDE